MTDNIITHRNAESVEQLIGGAGPSEPDLYTLVPFRPGTSRDRGPRDALFPAPAITADKLAAALQLWLQDEVTLTADVRASSEPQPGSQWKTIPTLSITEYDIVRLAAKGTPFEQPEAEHAYSKWCLRKFGVKVARPKVVYGWDDNEFWALETIQEFLRIEHAINIPVSDIAKAANNEECSNSDAQSFFDAQATIGVVLTCCKNLTGLEALWTEKEGPYYVWESLQAGMVTPWSGALSGPNFACRLAHAFDTEGIKPTVRYAKAVPGLLYMHEPPEEPDAFLVQRLAAGEWRAQLDECWGMKVKRVPMYSWSICPAIPGLPVSLHPNDAMHLPDPAEIFTAADMAKDMSQHLHADVTIDDVQKISGGHPPSADVKHAWDALVRVIAAAEGIIGIDQL